MTARTTNAAPRRLCWTVLVLMLAALAAAPAADALIIPAPGGRHAGILPRGGARARMGALAASAADAGRRRHHRRKAHSVAPARTGHTGTGSTPLARRAVLNPGDPLVYHTGGPVLGSHRTYAIYWNPSGQQAFPTGYQTMLGQYFGDVAADSGGHQNVYSLSAQYSGNGLAGTYSSTYAGMLADTNPYPPDQAHTNTSGCAYPTTRPGDPVYGYCLTDTQIQTELYSLITTNRWPSGAGAVYFVFLPPGVDQCMGAGAESIANPCADKDYCGYHDATGAQPSPASVLYDVIPYAGVSGCRSGQGPNGSGGDSPADDAISIVSHEHTETITDPLLSSWFDIHGNEIGDKCGFDYGSALGGPPLAQYNQVIGAHHYFVQQEWSNLASSCLQRDLMAQFSVAPTNNAPTPGTFTFDASSSIPAANISRYDWSFGDGASATGAAGTVTHTYSQAGVYSASLTITDTSGNTSSANHLVTVANPAAEFTISSHPGYTGQAIGFDGSSSTTPNGGFSSWTWNFGDGSNPTTTTTPTITHFFMRAGTYPVTLTVRDNSGNTASVTHPALIAAPITYGPSPSFRAAAGAGLPSAGVLSSSVGLLRVGNAQLVLSHGRLLLLTGRTLTCPAAAVRCSVSVTVTMRLARSASSGRHATVAIATATLTAGPGGRTVVQLHLSDHATALIRKLHRLMVTLDLRAQAGASGRAHVALNAVLHLPRSRPTRRHR